jgi:hypothetical protein
LERKGKIITNRELMELNEFASFQTLKEESLQQRNNLMELELASSSIPPFFPFLFFWPWRITM